MLSKLSALILRLWGWKIEGDYPHHLPKVLLLGLPHTSNWDFPVGVLLRSAMKLDVQFIAKSNLFKPPFGWFFRWLGGVPVERNRRTNFVDTMVEVFNREERFHTLIAPEGTRKKVDKLKTGFYYIAKGANVPLLPLCLDWGTKTLIWKDLIYLTDDMEADMARIDDIFRSVSGHTPENGYLYSG